MWDFVFRLLSSASSSIVKKNFSTFRLVFHILYIRFILWLNEITHSIIVTDTNNNNNNRNDYDNEIIISKQQKRNICHSSHIERGITSKMWHKNSVITRNGLKNAFISNVIRFDLGDGIFLSGIFCALFYFEFSPSY